MTDRPIIFNGAMVRALLTGTKTQTRRIVKITAVMGNKVAIESPDEKLIELEDGEFRRGICHYESTSALSGPYRLPYAVGDRLWVRENILQTLGGYTDQSGEYISQWSRERVEYCADDPPPKKRHLHPNRYNSPYMASRPSIHMPRLASRLTLTVTDVRVQRLQEISRGDAMDEGCPFANLQGCRNPRDWFADLWESLHGAGSWDANPWIVAVTFTVERSNIDEVKR